MNPNKNKICPFFLKGNCKYGENCYNYHPPGGEVQMQDQNPNPKPSHYTNPKGAPKSKICKFFLEGSCENPNCK